MLNDDFNLSNDLDPEEDLRMDNKIKRLELELKGAKFVEHNPDGIQLPAEIEAQMLDQILAFEKLKDDAKEIEIYQFLGKPKFRKIDTLSSEEIIIETERLIKLMAEKGIYLTSVEEIEEEVMYRFITEEFFYKMTLDMPIKGFIRHFLYEEFHPNERLNAEKTVEFFLQAFFGEEDTTPIDILCRDDAKSYLLDFKKLYDRFELKSYELISSKIKKIKGEVEIQIEFEGFIENSLKSHKFHDTITIEVKKRKGHWQISKLELPKPL